MTQIGGELAGSGEVLFAVPAEEQPQDDERHDEPADPQDEEPAQTIQVLDEP